MRFHRHLGAGRSRQGANGLGLAPAVQCPAVDLDQPIARLETSARGGGVVDGSDHHHVLAARRQLQADSPVLPLRRLLQGCVRSRIHEAGVRVQGAHHAVDCAVEQARLVHRLDIVVLDQREDVAEDVELPVGPGRVPGGLRELHGEEAAQGGARAEQEKPLHFAAPPLAPASRGGPLRLRLSHLSGSSGIWPSRSSKYRYGPLSEPVSPTVPTSSPARTLSPSAFCSWSRCAISENMPSPWSTMRRLPNPLNQPAWATLPFQTARTGLPIGARTSIPFCKVTVPKRGSTARPKRTSTRPWSTGNASLPRRFRMDPLPPSMSDATWLRRDPRSSASLDESSFTASSSSRAACSCVAFSRCTEARRMRC